METLPALNTLDPEMEKLSSPPMLAFNRQPDPIRCRLRATTDVEAVYCWLNEYQDRPHTFRSYQKEVDRLLLWCVAQHKKPLSQLDRIDLDAYLAFCQNPIPQSRWCSQKKGRGVRRGSSNWKPFSGPLTPNALHYSLTVLQSLFRYLVDAHYLLSNPLSLMRQQKRWLQQNRERAVEKRLLSEAEWGALRKTLRQSKSDTHQAIFYQARLRFIVALLFYTGMRVTESIQIQWCDFKNRSGLWWLHVQGKGNKPRLVPVTAALLNEIMRYRRASDQSPLPEDKETTRVLPLTTGRIRQLIAKLGQRAAQENRAALEPNNRLHKLSPHMFRHLMATTLAENQVAREHIQASLGHESLNTTDIYIALSDRDRYQSHEILNM